jgi:hypothetical protein
VILSLLLSSQLDLQKIMGQVIDPKKGKTNRTYFEN